MANFEKKKILLISSLTLLTILLLIFFKSNPHQIDSVISNGEKSVAEFYTQNLKPLFFKTELSKADVFNFAVVGTLPLDRNNNEYLSVGNEDNGDIFYELKEEQPTPDKNYYRNYKKSLKLNSDEVTELDSLLEHYKARIYEDVLFNENNTYAFESELPILTSSLKLELKNFQESLIALREGKVEQDNPDKKLSRDLISLAANSAKNKNRQYIVIAEDTVLNISTQFNKNAFRNEDVNFEMTSDFGGNNFSSSPFLNLSENTFDSLGSKISKTISAMATKVVVPNKLLDNHTRNLANEIFSIKIDEHDGLDAFSFSIASDSLLNNFGFQIKNSTADSTLTVNVNLNLNDWGELISEGIGVIQNMDEENWEDFDVDSLITSKIGEKKLIKIDSLNKTRKR